jgi:hypothetical protein
MYQVRGISYQVSCCLFLPFPIRDGTFYFQRGAMFFFLKKIFWFPKLLKKYSDFGGGKKNNMIQSFCHISFARQKKNLTRVFRKKYSERKRNPYPPCKLNGRTLFQWNFYFMPFLQYISYNSDDNIVHTIICGLLDRPRISRSL